MSNAIADGIALGKGNSLSPEPCALIPAPEPRHSFGSTDGSDDRTQHPTSQPLGNGWLR